MKKRVLRSAGLLLSLITVAGCGLGPMGDNDTAGPAASGADQSGSPAAEKAFDPTRPYDYQDYVTTYPPEFVQGYLLRCMRGQEPGDEYYENNLYMCTCSVKRLQQNTPHEAFMETFKQKYGRRKEEYVARKLRHAMQDCEAVRPAHIERPSPSGKAATVPEL